MAKELPIYLATITDSTDGVFSMSLVDYPATMVNWVTFSEDKQIENFAIQNEDEHLLCGVVMLADTNIYRRDGDFEYYLRYDKETVRLMAEKMLADKTFNRIDFMHNGEIIPEGVVNLVELFIKDDAKGISPSYLENIPDGSLLCTYKVNDEELWGLCKDGTFQGFSLSGFFTPVPVEQNNSNQNKLKTYMNKIKEIVGKILSQFGAVATDKGSLVWEGDGELKEGDIVTLEDGSQPENGDYKTEDGKTITIEDGKVAKIEDAEAEVAPEQEPEEMAEPDPEPEPEPDPEPEYDAKAEIEALRAEIDALKAELESVKNTIAEIVEKPAVPPVAEEFEKVTEFETGNAKLDKICKRVATLKH